jgi:hypothetical protein
LTFYSEGCRIPQHDALGRGSEKAKKNTRVHSLVFLYFTHFLVKVERAFIMLKLRRGIDPEKSTGIDDHPNTVSGCAPVLTICQGRGQFPSIIVP